MPSKVTWTKQELAPGSRESHEWDQSVGASLHAPQTVCSNSFSAPSFHVESWGLLQPGIFLHDVSSHGSSGQP